MTQFDPHC